MSGPLTEAGWVSITHTAQTQTPSERLLSDVGVQEISRLAGEPDGIEDKSTTVKEVFKAPPGFVARWEVRVGFVSTPQNS